MLAGTNPDYAIQDLYDAIASGNPVCCKNVCCVVVMCMLCELL